MTLEETNEQDKDQRELAQSAHPAIIDNPGPATARTTDPSTSFQAANSITPQKMRATYKAIVQALGSHGPSTDEEIASHIPAGTQSSSGLRTRRNELCCKRYVEFAGYKKRISSGLHAQVWRLTDTGIVLYEQITGSLACLQKPLGGEHGEKQEA